MMPVHTLDDLWSGTVNPSREPTLDELRAGSVKPPAISYRVDSRASISATANAHVDNLETVRAEIESLKQERIHDTLVRQISERMNDLTKSTLFTINNHLQRFLEQSADQHRLLLSIVEREWKNAPVNIVNKDEPGRTDGCTTSNLMPSDVTTQDLDFLKEFKQWLHSNHDTRKTPVTGILGPILLDLTSTIRQELRQELISLIPEIRGSSLQEKNSSELCAPLHVHAKYPGHESVHSTESSVAVVGFGAEYTKDHHDPNTVRTAGSTDMLRALIKQGDSLQGMLRKLYMDMLATHRISFSTRGKESERRSNASNSFPLVPLLGKRSRIGAAEQTHEEPTSPRLTTKKLTTEKNTPFAPFGTRFGKPAMQEVSTMQPQRQQAITELVDLLQRRDHMETKMQKVLVGMKFQTLVCLVIVLQTTFIGLEADWQVKYQNSRLRGEELWIVPGWFDSCSYMFSIFFIIELLARMIILRNHFFRPADQDTRYWNYFDIFVVCLSIPDFIPHLRLLDLGFLRAIRVLRMVRVVRAFRAAKELRKMIFALIHCLSSLFWLCVLMFLLLYIFCLVFMQAVSYKLAEMDVSSEFDAFKPWLGLQKSLMSLFGVVTGDEGWGVVLYPVMDISWFYYLMGVFFVVFFVFGFMNVATGLFVERAMESASQDREMAVQEAKAQSQKDYEILKELFAGADTDGDGTLTIKELREVVSHPEVQDFMASIDLDFSDDLDSVVAVLDPLGLGHVDAEAFFQIIGRFRGSARSLETTLLLFEFRNSLQLFQQYHTDHERNLGQIHTKLETAHTRTARVVQGAKYVSTRSSDVQESGLHSSGVLFLGLESGVNSAEVSGSGFNQGTIDQI